MVTHAFLLLNIVSLSLNIIVGLALAFAEWDEYYAFFGIYGLVCWGIIFLFQLKLFLRYFQQFKAQKNDKNDTNYMQNSAKIL